jgi:uncharacterized membrane protein
MPSTDTPRLARRALGVLITGAGIGHFTHADLFTRLVPASFGAHRSTINIGTGIFQVASGLSFLSPRLRGVARWSTFALLVPTFPEAVNQVREPDRMRELGIPPRVALARIPAQVLVLALVWWATRPDTVRS